MPYETTQSAVLVADWAECIKVMGRTISPPQRK